MLGLRSAIYPVADLDAARRWYAALLGQAPYFDQPFYVGVAVGGDPHDVGEGIVVAALRDPFGNRLGLIENPHFDIAKAR